MNNKHPENGGNYDATLDGLKDYVSGKLRQSLIVLWCAVGMILLIACVNLSNLLLARAAARAKEFAMRTALGAGRVRIVRQLLTESLVLSLCGAALGLAWRGPLSPGSPIRNRSPCRFSAACASTAHPSRGRCLIAVAASLLFGLAPGLRLTSGNLQSVLADNGRGLGQSRRHDRVRSTLVVSEIALACVLLVGAGLLSAQLSPRPRCRPGLRAHPRRRHWFSYDDSGGTVRRGVILQQIIQRIEQIPGVKPPASPTSCP